MWLASVPLDSAVSIGLWIHCLQRGCGKLVTPSGWYIIVQVYISSKVKKNGKNRIYYFLPFQTKKIIATRNIFKQIISKYANKIHV